MKMLLAVLAQAAESQSNPILGLLPIVLLFAVFYFLLIRPQRARMRQHQQLMAAVEAGDEVETIGGIFGTITRADDEVLWVEIAPSTTVRVSRSAIRRKIVSAAEDES